MRWIQQPESYKTKSLFYPGLTKDKFVPDYVASKSGHTRGSTIDLTIIPLNKAIHSIEISDSQLNNGTSILYLEDGSLYMCSHFDFMGEPSNHDTNLVS
jgi:zinc D-Ala-D-Ala dipeptidase